ncbi:Putative mannosyl-oligosaccharide glucosidase [Durusdinium trenchii]|uniref:Mannosyl-oligosaccharide glucosidase n=1 Tax=Durusdinium trenchii TaxID=1381693 RepID=A0ABP0P5P4_9DINO
MIRYTKGAWETLFYWWGGINRHLMVSSAFYLLFLVLLYYVQRRYVTTRIDCSTSGLSMLGSLTVFLLVFRMNQSMARNNEAEERTDAMFGEMDYLAHSVCHFMAGAREDHLHDLLLHPNVQYTEEGWGKRAAKHPVDPWTRDVTLRSFGERQDEHVGTGGHAGRDMDISMSWVRMGTSTAGDD